MHAARAVQGNRGRVYLTSPLPAPRIYICLRAYLISEKYVPVQVPIQPPPLPPTRIYWSHGLFFDISRAKQIDAILQTTFSNSCFLIDKGLCFELNLTEICSWGPIDKK